MAAAKSGKHVFTEKPFTLTRREAEACVKACADYRVTLAVAGGDEVHGVAVLEAILESAKTGATVRIN